MKPVRHATDARSLAGQWVGAAAAVGGFLLTGLSGLPEPPVLHPEHLLVWWGGHPPVVAAVSLLRLGGLVCGTYWLCLCSAVIVFTRSGRILRPGRLNLPGLGRLMKIATGGSLLGVAMVCATGCATTAGRPPTAAATPPELVPLGNAAAPAKTPAAAGPLLQTGQGASSPTTHPTATGEPAPSPTAPPPALRAGTDADTTATSWSVRPGDDLWSITESVLIARLGHAPDQRQIAALWLRVVDANRPNLPDPANPNLIFAGDIVTIPG